MIKFASIAICALLAQTISTLAFDIDSCKIDSALALASLKNAADSLDMKLVEVEPINELFDNVILRRAITGEIHWNDIYLAITCQGKVFSFSSGADSGYFQLIRTVLPSYEVDIPVQSIMDGYIRLIVDRDSSIVHSRNRDIVVSKTGYECITVPKLERRSGGYRYEWRYRFYSYESNLLYLHSIEFSYDNGFRYYVIPLP